MSVQIDYSPDQPRHPKGDPLGGKFAPIGVGAPVSAEQGNAHDPNKNIQEYLAFTSKFQREQSPDFPHPLPGEFQLEHGRGFIPDENTYRGRRGAQHQCYSNAGKAALYDPSLTYVEGFVSVHGVPIAHAWLSDSAGRLIDPTLKADASITRGYWGVPVKTSYLRETILRKETWGVLQYDNAENYLSTAPEKIVKKNLNAFDAIEFEITDAVIEFFGDDWRDQPRIPKGQSGSGQWTKGSGGGGETTTKSEPKGEKKGSGTTTPAITSKGEGAHETKSEKEKEWERQEEEKRQKHLKQKEQENAPKKTKPKAEAKPKEPKPKKEKVKRNGREIGEIEGTGKRWKATPERGGESKIFSSRDLATLYLLQMAARFIKRHARINTHGGLRRDGIDDHTPGGHEHDQKKHGHEQKKLPFEPPLHKQKDPNPREQEVERKEILKDKLEQQFHLGGDFENSDDRIVDLWDQHIKMDPEEFAVGMIGDKLDLSDSLSLDVRRNGKLLVSGFFRGGGHLEQTFDFKKKEVYLELINVPKSQPAGSTKSMMGAQVELFEKLGMEKVGLYANIRDGGYAWARYGFTPTDPAHIYGRVRRRSNELRLNMFIDTDEDNAIKSLASGSNPKTIWDIAAHPRGKELLLSNSWEGELDMKDPGQVQRLKRYVGR